MAAVRSTPRSVLTPFTALRLPAFRLVWAGETISYLGDNIQVIALAWLVLLMTGSGVALATVLIAAAIPRALLTLIAGALIDRVNAASMMLGSIITRGALVAILTILVATGTIQLWHLVIFAIAFGASDAVFFPAKGTVIASLVPGDQLASANSLLNSSTEVLRMIGPAIGGLIVALAGPRSAFALNALSFGVSGAALLAARARRRFAEFRPAKPRAEAGVPLRRWLSQTAADLREGLRYAWRDTALRTVLAVLTVIGLGMAGPFFVGVPTLARSLSTSATALGILVAAWGAGLLAGSLAGGSAPSDWRFGSILVTVTVWSSIAYGAVGFAPNLAWAAGLLLAAGIGIGVINVLVPTWLQRRTSRELLGRVMSFHQLTGAAIVPISLALAGPLTLASPRLLFLVGGVLVLSSLVLLTGREERESL